MTPRHSPSIALFAAACVLPCVGVPRLGADPPKIEQLRVQKVGDVVYYFDDSAHKKYHKKICMEPTQGSVTGTVTEEGDKKIINVATLEMGK